MASLTDGVREELRRDKVKLWLPPYTPNVNGDLAALARSYAERLGAESDAILAALEELRQFAVAKLREKTRVTLLGRVLGSAGSKPEGGGELKVEFDESELGSEVREKVCERIGTSKLKIIAGGKLLQDECSLSEQGWQCDSARKQQPLRVIFMASGPPRKEVSSAVGTTPGDAVGASGASSAPAVSADGNHDASSSSQEVEDMQGPSVSQIREAAERLTEEGFGDFELADAQTGRLVPVPPAARQALISALALHARGKEILSSRGEKAAARALEFLVEADASFQRCKKCNCESLLEQLSNVGQLQLDICWAYAILGDTGVLDDAEERLAVAERMIGRQVDPNFLKIAEVQAEQGKTLPPEVLPSVRLWLLQGVAKLCRGGDGRDDLQRAALFMQGVHVAEDAINNLLVLGATRVQAVAALRRCGGNVDRAAEELVSGAAQREAARKERSAQRKFGTTAAGDFVDPSCVLQLTGMGIEEQLAVAALKRANNDLSAALDAVQRVPREELLGGPAKPTSSTEEKPDDFSVATLMSMGFDRTAAERALLASAGNVEDALMALTAEQAATTPQDASEGLDTAAATSPDAAAPTAAEDDEKNRKDKEAETVAAGQSVADAHAAAHAEAHAKAVAEAQAAAEAKAEEERAKRRRLDEAREVVERELGQCLRRGDVDDEVAGAELDEEEALLQQYLSRF